MYCSPVYVFWNNASNIILRKSATSANLAATLCFRKKLTILLPDTLYSVFQKSDTPVLIEHKMLNNYLQMSVTVTYSTLAA